MILREEKRDGERERTQRIVEERGRKGRNVHTLTLIGMANSKESLR